MFTAVAANLRGVYVSTISHFSFHFNLFIYLFVFNKVEVQIHI